MSDSEIYILAYFLTFIIVYALLFQHFILLPMTLIIIFHHLNENETYYRILIYVGYIHIWGHLR